MRVVGLLALAFLSPVCAYATALININTADTTLLDTLPGIGPAYAIRIVDYRTAHGPFVRIEDIQNVSGIGPSTYADIAPLITVGDSSASSAPESSTATSSISVAPTSSSAASTYVPPASVLAVGIETHQNAIVEVPLHLTAHAMTKNNIIDLSARVLWGFGDGSGAEGTVVDKVYHYEGSYLVTVTATNGMASARDEFMITVRPAQVRVLEVSGTGITIANDANERLDLSEWSLSSDAGFFRIPNGTVILPKAKVLFPSAITNLVATTNAMLVYPSGVIATRYTPLASTLAAPVQPSVVATSYKQVQKVEPIISVKETVPVHEEAVIAPAAANELAAAGAGVSLSTSRATTTSPRATSLFRSPWTFGFLSVMALAGGAFIFL